MDFIDLKAQQSRIRTKIDKRIKSVLNHGKYIMGPEVFELEEKLSKYVGMRYCISCSSGTDALLIPLMLRLRLYLCLVQNQFLLTFMIARTIWIQIILKTQLSMPKRKG